MFSINAYKLIKFSCDICGKNVLKNQLKHLHITSTYDVRKGSYGIQVKHEFEETNESVKSDESIHNFKEEKYDYPNQIDYKDVWASELDNPKYRRKPQNQADNFKAPEVADLSKTTIILFPGQGTQYVGMTKDLLQYPNVKEMYKTAEEILEYDLLKLCLEGPLEKLTETKYQQPAVFMASLAALEKLKHENIEAVESCIATAGFSVGEFTSLTFSGALNFHNALKLIKIRAEAMQIASEVHRSGMMTVFYGPDSRLKFACNVAKEFCQKSYGIPDAECRIANYLYPHCKVVAGNVEALDFIIKNKDDFKLKKIKKLNVSGAFHTKLMMPAAEIFSEAIKNTPISRPIIPVYSNIDAKAYNNAYHIRKSLPKQIVNPVKWEQTLHTLYERPKDSGDSEAQNQGGFPKTYECGPGKSIKSILKMVNSKASEFCYNIEA